LEAGGLRVKLLARGEKQKIWQFGGLDKIDVATTEIEVEEG
jgi:hypothetical protein